MTLMESIESRRASLQLSIGVPGRICKVGNSGELAPQKIAKIAKMRLKFGKIIRRTGEVARPESTRHLFESPESKGVPKRP
jgi:hypothetical protein